MIPGILRKLAVACVAACAAAGTTPGTTPAQSSSSSPAHAIHVEGEVEGTHDPSIAKEGDTWYVFGTRTNPKIETGQLPIRCSNDLHQWKRCGFRSEEHTSELQSP